MLNAENWRFDAPQCNYKIDYDLNIIKNKIQKFYYNHLVSVCYIQDIDKYKESDFDVNSLKDCDYYQVNNLNLSQFLKNDFLDHFIKRGNFTSLSTNTRIDCEDCACVTPNGQLVLSLEKETYQSLGLTGKLSHFAKSTRNRYSKPGRQPFRPINQSVTKHHSKRNCYNQRNHHQRQQYCNNDNHKMPPYRYPRTLQQIAICAVGEWVLARVPQLLAKIDADLRCFTTQRADPQLTLQRDIVMINRALVANVPRHLYDAVAYEVLQSVKQLIERTKKTYYPHINMSHFMTEINVAVGLTEVVLGDHLKQIDFSKWPKIMRYVLYKNLHKLTGLEVLNLGSCTGGWQNTEYDKCITQGVAKMNRLRSLCLCFDCTDSILQILAENCKQLQCLDVTASRSVTDRSVPHLLKFQNLYQLQMHRTSITIEGFAQLLVGLDKLQDIGRCDEFGSIISHVHFNYPKAGPFELKHLQTRDLTTQNLRLLVNMCPNIEHVSLFHDEQFSDLTILSTLDRLKDLKLLSCDFYTDYMKQLLEVRGCNLVSLHLEHVEELDLNALVYISQYCPQLKNLVLYNCDFVDQAITYQRYFRVKPFQHLERIFWVVDGALAQLEFLLTHALNIRYIHLGSSTGISHQSIVQVMEVNPMKELIELRILYSSDMNLKTAKLLLASCGKLKLLSELEGWQGISVEELATFKKFVCTNNYDLDIRPILSY